MSGEVQADIADAYRVARQDIEAGINRLLEANEYGSKLTKWAYIAIIMAVEDPLFSQVATLHKRRGVVEFRLKIPHADFAQATATEQRELLLRSLLRSVEQMASVGVKDLDAVRLRSDLLNLGRASGWL